MTNVFRADYECTDGECSHTINIFATSESALNAVKEAAEESIADYGEGALYLIFEDADTKVYAVLTESEYESINTASYVPPDWLYDWWVINEITPA